MRAEDMAVRPVLSLLSKGKSGSGKTIASCGKEFRPVYVADFDGRFESVLRYYKRMDGHVRDIETDFYPAAMGSYSKFINKLEEIDKYRNYKTVSVASLTNYIHTVLAHLIEDKAGKTRPDGRPFGKAISGIRVNELEDYLAEDTAIWHDLIGNLMEIRAGGVNVILEAHITPYEITSIDPESRGKETYTVNHILTKGKKAPAHVPVNFNEVYLFTKEVVGFGQSSKFKVNPIGTPTDECKTSMDIEPFEWTRKDFSEELWKQVDQEIKDTPRLDPNAPKKVNF